MWRSVHFDAFTTSGVVCAGWVESVNESPKIIVLPTTRDALRHRHFHSSRATPDYPVFRLRNQMRPDKARPNIPKILTKTCYASEQQSTSLNSGRQHLERLVSACRRAVGWPSQGLRRFNLLSTGRLSNVVEGCHSKELGARRSA